MGVSRGDLGSLGFYPWSCFWLCVVVVVDFGILAM